MAKELIFSLDCKPLIEKLLEAQSDMNQAKENGDEVRARLHQYDFNGTLEKLNITPCRVCYHGEGLQRSFCQLASRCQSYIIIDEVQDTTDAIHLHLSLVFEVI